MAWLFELSIECGDDESIALEVASTLEQTLAANSTVNTSYWIGIKKYENAYWCLCVPDVAGRSGIVSKKELDLVTALAFIFYEDLRLLNTFRYAIVGHETEFFRTMIELKAEEPSILERLKGLVVSRPLWIELGSPHVFEHFSDGYLWIPYETQE